MIRTLLAALLLGGCFSGVQAADDPQAAFQSISQLYHGYTQDGCLRCEFDYSTRSRFDDSEEQLPGTIWLQGNRFRLEAEGNLFIRDSLQFYQIYCRDRQIIIEQAAATTASAQPTAWLSDLSAHLQATEHQPQADGSDCYLLEPLQGDWLLEVLLYNADNQIRRLELLDINDSRTVIQITSQQHQQQFADSLFLLPDWTSGYEVIDLRGDRR